jgi:hypothetical protein
MNLCLQVKLENRLRLLTYGTANNDRNFVELQRCVARVARIILLSTVAHHCATVVRV